MWIEARRVITRGGDERWRFHHQLRGPTLTVHHARILEIGSAETQQEGTSITLPLRLISEGDVGGMTFRIGYDPDFLSNPQLSWESSLGRRSAT